MTLQLTKPLLGKPELDAIERVLNSGWLAEGEETAEFEQKIARYVHADHAVAVCNCTVAIELALKASGVKGYISIPDFTHPATALAIQKVKGCAPALCDVSLDDFNIIGGSNFQAAVPVSWAGNPIRKYPYCLIVEDAACSLGSSYQGKMTGSEFTTCFSFHPRKLITCGEGAVITTNDKQIGERIHELKNFGIHGGNYRLSDIASAVASVQLNRLEWLISRRCEMAKIYRELLEGVEGVKPPKKIDGARQTWQTFAVQLETADRDLVIQKLKAKGIETQIGTYALHLLPQFSKLHRCEPLKNSEVLHRQLLALPMAHDLTEIDQQRVCDELSKAIK